MRVTSTCSEGDSGLDDLAGARSSRRQRFIEIAEFDQRFRRPDERGPQVRMIRAPLLLGDRQRAQERSARALELPQFELEKSIAPE